MILCAGLSPAWQQIAVLDQLELDEVNRFRECHWCASGKVLNVGLAVHRLGTAGRTVSIIGGPTGESIRREFNRVNCPASWVETSQPTRVCTTLLDRRSRQTTELVENAGTVDDGCVAEFCQVFNEQLPRATAVVLSGSLPAGVDQQLFAELLSPIPTEVPTVLDIRGPALELALPANPWLVKPNRSELADTVRRPLHDEEDVARAMREVIDRGARAVCITQGADNVFLMTGGSAMTGGSTMTGDSAWSLKPPACDVVNPIGCGDCLAAGIAVRLAAGSGWVEAVKFGMGAAADNVSQLLPACLDPQRVAALAEQVIVDDWMPT